MVLVSSFCPPYLNSSLFSHFTNSLCICLSCAKEVFDDEESSERRTILRFRREHVESASETPRYLQFFVDLTNFSAEFANGPTFIRSLMEFSIYLTWRVLSCDRRGNGKKLRDVQNFLSVASSSIIAAAAAAAGSVAAAATMCIIAAAAAAQRSSPRIHST